ncbi:ROK family transcriptional regulator [Asanoa siamensis]|uniref:Xylose repressor n=1 Tax=Asanoa siamensis TaxID=926357 RepID=A0ABQ4CNZ7_9ACTN|nr:ROK family transcriptional regulator [Asanoa siamensis]GIF73023.1 xylose repressor [Asanoa siamensis]
MIGLPSATRPTDLADVRVTNLALVLRHVRAHAPCSRADIAAATGLNKATVSSLVTDLIARRLLRESGLVGSRIGRPATMLTLEGMPYAAIGIEVGPDHLTAVAVDFAGGRLLTWRRAAPAPSAPAGRTVAAVAALAARAVGKVTGQGRTVLGLTLGTADAAHDGLGAQVNRSLHDPSFEVVVARAADLAALAEQREGSHAGSDDLVHLRGGAGVTAGIIAGGRPLRGARGLAGSIGHLTVDPDGPRCDCGRRGCLDLSLGLPALFRAALPTDETPADWGAGVERLVTLARTGDAIAVAALAAAGARLGDAVRALADVLDPSVVLLGGALTPLAPWLVPAATARLDDRHVVVAASTVEPHAVALGGAALALGRLEAGALP